MPLADNGGPTETHALAPGSPAIDAGGGPRLSVSGSEEVVFDWTADRCEDLDIPDLPARAFRDLGGNVQLISSHFNVRRFIGTELDNVVHDCNVVFPADNDADPAEFNDAEWIASLYTEDGATIHALVHNEYQGWEHPDQCSSPANFDCWYNAITLAESTDAGVTYDHAATPPEHLVASVPRQYVDGAGPYGLFSPSNIIKGPEGYYYALVRHDAIDSGEQWSCLMRSDDLSDPDSWRFWDGTAFAGEFVNPYPSEPADPADHLCAPVDQGDIANMNQSLTWNSHLDRYVLVGATGKTIGGEPVFAFYYAFSEDLLDWTERRLLIDVRLSPEVENDSDVSYAYPSLLDPDTPSRNFETTDDSVYLYYTRFNVSRGPGSLDRDLLRRKVTFSRPCETLDTDQRGMARADGACDIGAYEFPGGVRPIARRARVKGALPTGGAQWFRFTATGRQRLSLQTNGFGGDTHMQLFKGGEPKRATAADSLAEDDNSGPGQFSNIRHSVDAGPYLIRVRGRTDVNPYFLRLMSAEDILAFGDTQGHFAETAIGVMSAAGITGGCGSGMYCPDEPVTRAQMALFMLRAIQGGNQGSPPATGNVFGDVGPNSFAANAIEEFSTLGITAGCGGGNYCPDDPVTREQMAIFLLRALFGAGHTPPQATQAEINQFSDISDSFARDWIVQLVDEGITGGCGDGNQFCPTDPVTRGQMAAFIQRTFDLDTDL